MATRFDYELTLGFIPPDSKENTMKLKVRAFLICLVCLTIVPAALPQKHRLQPTASITGNPRPSEPTPQNKNWKVTGIKVKQYRQATGQLEELNLEQEFSTSANAPFGPLLVIVEITGELEAGTGKSINLIATEGRKAISRGTYSPGPYQGMSEDGKTFYAPFWIDSNTLCDPLKLTARVVGQRQASTMTRTVKFLCGE
jgi:hypothetical protein